MKPMGLCLLLGLIAAQPAFSQQRKSDRERDGLVGDVHAVRESYRFPSRDSNGPNPHESHTTRYYGRNGSRTLELEYWGEQLVTRKTFRRAGADELIETIEDGGWDERDGTSQKPPTRRVIKRSLKYAGDGSLSEESLFSEDGALLENTEYRFDRRGRLVEERTNTGQGHGPPRTTTFKYGDGNELVSSTYTFGTQPVVSFTYELDAKGNWTRRLSEGVGAQIERTITYYSLSTGEGVPIPGESQEDPLRPRPASGGPPMVVRKSGGVLQQMATRRVEPSYPPDARATHITGKVVVELLIDHFGDVVDAKALSGPRELQDAAVAAAKLWKFQPTRLSGQPVDVIGTITFNFQM
jgi:TonB family protein